MRFPRLHLKKRKGGGGGFSVIELMLAVAIMGVIVYALYSVFNQTQRAMRNSEIQGDVSEKARAIMEIISREIEQAQPTFTAFTVTNGSAITYSNTLNMVGGIEYLPRIQKSDRPDIRARTNVLHDLFFLTKQSNSWFAYAYRVVNVTNGVGALMRYQTNMAGRLPRYNELHSVFLRERPSSTNYHYIADGVIHFKLTAFDPNGHRLGWDTTNFHRPYYRMHRMLAGAVAIDKYSDVPLSAGPNVILEQGFSNVPEETRFAFSSNALPATIELELAMLEPETLKQYYTMLADDNWTAATNFLARQINKVHLFRQRIPIRTAAQ